MAASARHDKLIELIKGPQPVDARRIIVRGQGSITADIYVNGVRLVDFQDSVMQMPANRILRVQISADTGYKSRCARKSEYRGRDVRVLKQTAYSLHYTSTYKNQPYEYDLSLLSESYTWEPAYTWNTRYGAGTGKAYSTGAHPNVKNNVFEWKLPQIDRIQGGKEFLHLFIKANLDWSLNVTGEGRTTKSEHNISLGLKVEIPVE
jgi:hypothetical protein